MVGDVAGQDVSQRAYSEGIVAGDAFALPGLCGQIAEKEQRSQTKHAELFHMAGPRDFVGLRSRNADFLIEAGQRIGKAAGKPERAEDENALAVVHMTKDFADGPLLRRIAMERFLFRDAGQQVERLVQLNFKFGDYVVRGHEIDVAGIVWSGFG